MGLPGRMEDKRSPAEGTAPVMSPFTYRQHMISRGQAANRRRTTATRERVHAARRATDAARGSNSSCLRSMSVLPGSVLEPLQLSRGRTDGCFSDGEGEVEERTYCWPSFNPVEMDVYSFLAPKPAVTPSKVGPHVRWVRPVPYSTTTLPTTLTCTFCMQVHGQGELRSRPVSSPGVSSLTPLSPHQTASSLDTTW